MRASKLLLALGLTAGILALPDDGVPGQVDTGNAAKGPHGHWPLGPPGRRDEGAPAQVDNGNAAKDRPHGDWPFGPAGRRDEATQTKDTTSVTDRAEAKAKHDPAVPPNAKVSPPEERAVHPAGSGDLPQHPPRDKPCNPLDPGCWDKHQSGPNEPRQVSKENSGMDGMPPIDPPSKGHTSPPPKFKDHHEERFLVIPAMADDDWTHWACSRGVQWACQYPDIDKRDVLFLDYKQACDTARQACDYYADNCACQWAEHCEDKIEWWPFNDVEDEIKACLCRLGYLDYRGNCPNFGADQNFDTPNTVLPPGVIGTPTALAKRDDHIPIKEYLEACNFARLACYKGQDGCGCDRLEYCGEVEADLDDGDVPHDVEVEDDFKTCLCSIGYTRLCPPKLPTTTVTMVPATLAKRDDIPTEVGQIVTGHGTNPGGQEYTVRMSLSQTSPWIQVNDIDQQGTSHKVILSQIPDHPNLAVQTHIYGDYTSEATTRITANPTSFGPLTTVDLAKRGSAATPTPAITNVGLRLDGLPEDDIRDAFSSVPKASVLSIMSLQAKRVSNAFEHFRATASPSMPASDLAKSSSSIILSVINDALSSLSTGQEPFPFTPARREIDQVDTMTILDEQPGHTTLNPELVTQTHHHMTGVTVVNHHGSKLTVSATTDSKGNAILVTQGLASKAKETCTVTLVLNRDKVETILPTKTGKDMVTETAHVLRLPTSTIEAPIPKVMLSTSAPPIEAPIPKVEIQTHGSTVIKVITETVTMFARPYTTLYPMEWDPTYAEGWDHVLHMHLADLKKAYPNARWDDEILRLARHLHQRNPTWTKETSMKHALILLHRHLRPSQHIPMSTSHEEKITQFVVKLNGSSVPMTAPVQKIGGHVYSIDSLIKYNRYDPRTFAVAPMGSCHDNDGDHHDDHQHSHLYAPVEVHRYNKTECAIEQCMWNYMKPIQITTVEPQVYTDFANGRMGYDYFTHSTHLDQVHWGTSELHGLYYPTGTAQFKNGTTHIIRHTPLGMDEKERMQKGIHLAPHCSDVESCHDLCIRNRHHHGINVGHWWYYALGVLFLVIVAGIFLCCLALGRRRRQKDPERRRAALTDKLRRKPTEKPQEVVVNQVTGDVTDTAGRPVDPATAATSAVVAGPAAGAAAAENRAAGTGDDGRGTTGRQAEEGRGRVNFADNEKPADQPKTVVESHPAPEPASSAPAPAPAETHAPPPTTVTQATEAHPAETHPAEHTEPTPVHDKDGAGGVGTGRQQPDIGSMRGRQRRRPEGQGIAGLGF